MKLYENRYLYLYNLVENLKPLIVPIIGYDYFNGLAAKLIIKHYHTKD